jgi:hypothetical protein
MDDNKGSSTSADGYYAEDNMGSDELDLSFLDDKDEK